LHTPPSAAAAPITFCLHAACCFRRHYYAAIIISYAIAFAADASPRHGRHADADAITLAGDAD